MAAEHRANDLASTLATRAAAVAGKDHEISVARQQVTGACARVKAAETASAVLQGDNDRLQMDLQALAQQSSQVTIQAQPLF